MSGWPRWASSSALSIVSIIGPNTERRASCASSAVFGENPSMMAAATRSAAGSPFFLLVTVVSNLPRAMPRPS